MTPRIIALLVLSLLITVVAFYKIVLRRDHIDSEENDLKAALESIFQSEVTHFKECGFYTADSGAFGSIHARRPLLVGLLPECKDTSSAVVHVFLGPHDGNFREQARKAMELEVIKGQCHSLETGFTAFAAQNLDEDDELELWSIDQSEDITILVQD